MIKHLYNQRKWEGNYAKTILNFAVDNGYNGKQAYKSKHTLIF